MDLPVSPTPRRAYVGATFGAGAGAAGATVLTLAAASAVRAHQLSLVLEAQPRPRRLGPWLVYALGSHAHPLPLYLWIGATLVAFAAAVRWGYPGAPRGLRDVAERAWGVLVAGMALATAIVLPAETQLPAPATEVDDPILILAGAGAALLIASVLGRRSRAPAEAEVPALAGGTTGSLPAAEPAHDPAPLPGTYGLAVNGPPVPAEESERPVPAVEVRVRWGGDLLRVVHLEPPRSFSVEEDGALVLLGRSDTPSVLAPRGATGVVRLASGESCAVERAAQEGLGERQEGGKPGTRIPLRSGTEVTMTLSSRAGTAYRAAGGGSDVPAPILLEIAMVNAGRVVGRRPSLRGATMWLAITAGIATGAAATLWRAERTAVPRSEEDAGQVFVHAAVEALEAVERREKEDEPPEPESPPLRYPSLERRPASYPYLYWPPPETVCEALRADASVAAFIVPWVQADCGRGLGWTLGLHLSDTPPRAEALGLDALDPLDTARLGSPRVLAAKVRVGPPTLRGRLPPTVVDRVVREHVGRLRACYQRGLFKNPLLRGRVSVRFLIERGGRVSQAWNGGSDIPDSDVVTCMVHALHGISFPPPDSGIVTATYPFELGGGPGDALRDR